MTVAYYPTEAIVLIQILCRSVNVFFFFFYSPIGKFIENLARRTYICVNNLSSDTILYRLIYTYRSIRNGKKKLMIQPEAIVIAESKNKKNVSNPRTERRHDGEKNKETTNTTSRFVFYFQKKQRQNDDFL